MKANKLSISLSSELCDFMNDYQRNHHCKTRSEVIAKALELLMQKQLEQEYRLAAEEIDPAWDSLAGEGLDNESW
mgnify:CR=1 FL=1